jgi:hypothetical protein
MHPDELLVLQPAEGVKRLVGARRRAEFPNRQGRHHISAHTAAGRARQLLADSTIGALGGRGITRPG